jgi:hypothetical protein
MSITVGLGPHSQHLRLRADISAYLTQASIPVSHETHRPLQPLELHAEELWRKQVPAGVRLRLRPAETSRRRLQTASCSCRCTSQRCHPFSSSPKAPASLPAATQLRPALMARRMAQPWCWSAARWDACFHGPPHVCTTCVMAMVLQSSCSEDQQGLPPPSCRTAAPSSEQSACLPAMCDCCFQPLMMLAICSASAAMAGCCCSTLLT